MLMRNICTGTLIWSLITKTWHILKKGMEEMEVSLNILSKQTGHISSLGLCKMLTSCSKN